MIHITITLTVTNKLQNNFDLNSSLIFKESSMKLIGVPIKVLKTKNVIGTIINFVTNKNQEIIIASSKVIHKLLSNIKVFSLQ